MTRRFMIYLAAMVWIVVVSLVNLAMVDVKAWGIEINNFYETNETTIVSGVSDVDLARGLSMASAAGGHQFDFATYHWQGSIVGAWYDDEDAVSFGVGKRWEKVDGLFHVNYTQNGSSNLYVVGATWRF